MQHEFHFRNIISVETTLSVFTVPHHTAMPGYAGAGFARNGRPFERNPTTWVPQAPLRNGESGHTIFLNISLLLVNVFSNH